MLEKSTESSELDANLAEARKNGEQADRIRLFGEVHDTLNATANVKGANNYGNSKYKQEVILSKTDTPVDMVDLIAQNKTAAELEEKINFYERTGVLMNSHVDINCENRDLGIPYFRSMQNQSPSFIIDHNYQFVCVRDSRRDTNPSSPKRRRTGEHPAAPPAAASTAAALVNHFRSLGTR